MTHLRIEQNNGVIEEVSSSVITKLYEIAHAGLDASSNLLGRLHVAAAYGYLIDYITQQYPNLYINADKRYFHFEDSVVELLCATKWGDGTGISESDMWSVTSIDMNTFGGNTNIQTFDELGDFPNLTRIQTFGFVGCTNLRSIDLSNILYFGGQAFDSTALTGIINLPSAIEIGDNSRGQAFGYIAGITEVHIGPNFLRFVSGASFKHCSLLTKVTGLENIASIPGETFREDSSLLEVDISSAKNIGGYAFLLCGNLTDIGELSGTVQIGRDAFSGNTNLLLSCIDNVEVMLVNDSNGSVGGLFRGCRRLTEITLSPNCTQIGSWTFFDCLNLEKINNTSLITRIGEAAFNKCRKLQSLDLSNLDMTDSYTLAAFAKDSSYNWDNGLFNDCVELRTLGRNIFPNVTHIGMRCFPGLGVEGSLNFPDLTDEVSTMFGLNHRLEYLYLGHLPTLNKSNTFDKNGQFQDCENLKMIYLGDSLTNFLPYHFRECTNLRAIILNNPNPPGCVNTDGSAYEDARVVRNDMLGNSLCFLYVPDSAVNTYKQTYPWSKFPDAIKSFKDYSDHFEFYNETFTNGKYQGYGFDSLNIVDSSGSGSLPQNAFNSCANLTNVTLEGISSIGVSAFGSCTSLESINLDEVTIDGDGAFIGCTSLTTIGNNSMLSLFPNGKVRTWSFGKCSSLLGPFDFTGITEIGGSSFERTGLSGVLNLPDVVTIRSSNAFGNTNITKAIIGDSITSIGGSCFNGCTSLTEVDIDFSNIPVANLGNMTSFVSGCTSLQTFDCTGLQVLANGFFLNCTALTSITGLNSITTIADQAFKNCTALTSITIPSTCTTISQLVFAGCSNLTTINGLTSITYIGKQAFDGCSNLDVTDLNLSNVTTIQASSYLFRNCSNLKGTLNLSGLSNNSDAGDFMGCSKLQKIIFGSIGLIYSSRIGYGYCQFGNCNLLEVIDVSQVNKITFSSCAIINNNVFKALIIRNTSQIPTLTIDNNSIPAITWDKFAPNAPNAKIYVDDSLYSTYINDPDWSILASHIDVISNYVAS